MSNPQDGSKVHAIAKRLGGHHPEVVPASEDAATPVFRRVRAVMATDDGHFLYGVLLYLLEVGIFPRKNWWLDFHTFDIFFFFFFFFFLEEEEMMTKR